MGRETDTDADLIAACRRGETAAFGIIVERYQRAVCAVAYAAVRDRVLAEDIAQDTFVMAWSKLGSLRDLQKLPAWLCGIARNVARARVKRARRETPADIDVIGGSTPFDELDERQTHSMIAEALARMPAKYREPLVLFYCDDQSAKDVGVVLGLSDQAVHQRLSRGRQFLASDTQLFAQAVGRTVRPRRDLAAAVLAAIAIGVGSSSRVEASPRPRGTNVMLKLAAPVLVAGGVAGTVAYVASTPSSTPSSHAASVLSPQPRPVIAAHVANAPALPAAITCSDTATYLADIIVGGSKTATATTASRLIAFTRWQVEEECESAGWSTAFMTCLMGENDAFSMLSACERLAPGPHDLPLPAVTDAKPAPIPAESSHDCATVARHLARLLDPNETDSNVRATMNELGESRCKTEPWTEEHRVCIASATTIDALENCE